MRIIFSSMIILFVLVMVAAVDGAILIPIEETTALFSIASLYVNYYCGEGSLSPDSVPPCSWPWVTCDAGHVVGVALSDCRGGGTFPFDTLDGLPMLRDLILLNDGLVGKGFDGARLHSLETAYLWGNDWDVDPTGPEYFGLTVSPMGLFLFVALYVVAMWGVGALVGYFTRNC